MLKEISGRLYMTGTSEGSLYPMVMHDPKTDIRVGCRMEIQNGPNGVIMIGLFARMQQFEEGEAVPMRTDQIFAVAPGCQLRLASAMHLSGGLGQGVFNPAAEPDKSHQALAQKFGELFMKSMQSAHEKMFPKTVLLPDEDLVAIGQERYMRVIAGDIDEAAVEEQLSKSTDSFDFLSMLNKPGSEAKPD